MSESFDYAPFSVYDLWSTILKYVVDLRTYSAIVYLNRSIYGEWRLRKSHLLSERKRLIPSGRPLFERLNVTKHVSISHVTRKDADGWITRKTPILTILRYTISILDMAYIFVFAGIPNDIGQFIEGDILVILSRRHREFYFDGAHFLNMNYRCGEFVYPECAWRIIKNNPFAYLLDRYIEISDIGVFYADDDYYEEQSSSGQNVIVGLNHNKTYKTNYVDIYALDKIRIHSPKTNENTMRAILGRTFTNANDDPKDFGTRSDEAGYFWSKRNPETPTDDGADFISRFVVRLDELSSVSGWAWRKPRSDDDYYEYITSIDEHYLYEDDKYNRAFPSAPRYRRIEMSD